MNYIITPMSTGDYISDLLLPITPQCKKEVRILNSESFSAMKTPLREKDKLYLTSDTLYPLIHLKLPNRKRDLVKKLRNKYQCRVLLQDIFPNFFFDKTHLTDLHLYPFDFNRHQKYVIKPLVGFMAGGVRIIDKNTNLKESAENIKSELGKFSALYPNIFSEELMIEEYVSGENEYAIDVFYDEAGLPVILNIYCHPKAKRKEYLQMLYYTHHTLFKDLYQNALTFFSQLNAKLQMKSFPMHVEFKLSKENHLLPIEFNAYRFGGMGLSDLTYYAFDFHPINAYFNNQHPNWTSIWKFKKQNYFCWVLGYNAADRDLTQYAPSHHKFQELLPKGSQLLAYKPLNYQKMPAFALVYLVTKNKSDLEHILNIEFNDCFVKNSSARPHSS